MNNSPTKLGLVGFLSVFTKNKNIQITKTYLTAKRNTRFLLLSFCLLTTQAFAQMDCMETPCGVSENGNGPLPCDSKVYCSNSDAVEHGFLDCASTVDGDFCSLDGSLAAMASGDVDTLLLGLNDSTYYQTGWHVQWVRYLTDDFVNEIKLQIEGGEINSWAVYWSPTWDYATDTLATSSDYCDEPLTDFQLIAASSETAQWSTVTNLNAPQQEKNLYYIAFIYENPSPLRLRLKTKECNIAVDCEANLTCPSDTLLGCSNLNALNFWLNEVEATACGNQYTAVNDYDPSSFTECSGTGVETITWSLIDENGTTVLDVNNLPIVCTAVLTLEDNTAPAIICPPNITLDCAESTEPIPTTTGTISRSETEVVLTWFPTQQGFIGDVDLSVSGAPTGAIITDVSVHLDVDHSWLDDLDLKLVSPDNTTITLFDPEWTCGNTDNMSATFTDSGTYQNCVEVNTDTLPASFGCLSAYETAAGLSGNVRPTQALSIFDGETPNGTWTIIVNDDSLGNGGCVINASISVDWIKIETGVATATDCMLDTMEYSDVSTQTFFGCSQYDYTIERTWKATDNCNQTSTCVQIITVEDTTPPTVVFPPGQTLTCFENLPPSANNMTTFANQGGIIEDNCSTSFTIFSTVSSNNANSCPGNAQIVTRTYYVQDVCGNTTVGEQIFTYLESDTAPVILSVLPACYKSCSDMANIQPSDVTFTTDCSYGAEVVISGPEVIGEDNCNGTIYRFSYVAVDDCGRSSEPVTRDMIVNNDGPNINCMPFNLILDCGNPNNEQYIEDYIGAITAYTSCNLGVSISHYPVDFTNLACDSASVVTFVATDACGRTASCTNTIAVLDNTAPVFTVIPPSICDVIECGADADYWFDHWINYMVTGMEAVDQCDDTVSIFALDPQLNIACDPSGNAVTTVEFLATDDCNNYTSYTGTFLIQNTAPAFFYNIPADLIQSCNESVDFGDGPTISELCQTTVDTVDVVDDTNPCLLFYTRTWIATDACGDLTNSVSQTITLVNDSEPIFVDVPDNAVLTCGVAPQFGDPVVIDACSNVSLSFVDSQVGSGCSVAYTRTWTASDECGNSATASQTLSAIDGGDPEFTFTPNDEVIDCNELPVFGTPTVIDDCGQVDLEFMDTESGDDCYKIYTRIWTATDACDNSAIFVQTITTSDTETPYFTFVPANGTSPCLDANGSAITYAQICSSSDDAEEEVLTGAMDLLSSDLEMVLDDSQDKEVEVGLRFKDLNVPAGATITSAWIQFTADATIDVDPSILSINGEDSDDAATFTDGNGNISNRPRTSAQEGWTPGDWMVIGDNKAAQKTSDLSSIVQEIVDRNGYTSGSALAFFISGTGKRTAMSFDLSPDQAPELYITYEHDPFGNAIAEDNCSNLTLSYIDEEINNGCAGSRTRIWTATDACGLTTTASQTIAFVDQAPPIFTFIPEHVNSDCDYQTFPPVFGIPEVMDNCSNVTIVSEDYFEEGDENSCVEEVDYDYRRMWTATDACGNTTTAIQRFNVNGNQYSSLWGLITTETMEPVTDVMVTLEGGPAGGGMTEYSQTLSDGIYGYDDLPLGYNYEVSPFLNDNPINGVTSFDLILITRHILQTELLDSPYKIIAADANRSGSVTTIDVVELQQMILQINLSFPGNNSWRFIEAAFVFPTPDSPFASLFPETVSINNLMLGEQHDFIGVKIGDVNNSVVANLQAGGESRTFVDDLVFRTADQELKAGEDYKITFHANDFEAIYGYQFTMDYDRSALDFLNIEAGELDKMNEDNFGLSLLKEGAIPMNWVHSEAQTIGQEAAIFHVSFKAKRDVLLSEVLRVGSRYTKAEAYNGDMELMDVKLRFDETKEVTTRLRLYQNTPNPFKQETLIGFELPEASNATLSIYDVSGQLVKQVAGDYEKGYNNIVLSSDAFSAGMYHYQLVSPAGIAVRKMIVK